jgi:HK97 family phage portal protein
MGSVTDLFKQAVGLAPIRPTPLDLKLLTDGIGRTLPMSGYSFTGANGTTWLNYDQALTRDQYQGVVFLIVSNILRKAIDIPWGVFRPGKQDERAELVEAGHPLNKLMWKPNLKDESWADVIEGMGGYLLLRGNSYAFGVKPEAGSKRGQLQELYTLPAQRVKPVAGERFIDPVKEYRFDEGNGKYTVYQRQQIAHCKYWNPDSGAEGLSPIAAMSKMATAADSAIQTQVGQFQNQGPKGIVFDKSSTEPWTSEQQSTVRSWWNSFFTGGRRSGELPIVGGELGYLQLGLSPADLDVLEALQVTTRHLCSGFGYPAELLNDKAASTYNNVSEARKAALTDAVLPLLRRVRDAVNRLLGDAYADNAYFDIITSGIPELQEDRSKQATMLSTAYWIPVQDKQREMGIKPDDTLPKYLFPSTLVTAEELGAAPAGADEAPKPGAAAN